MRTGTDVLHDVLILLEKKAYALAEKEYEDKRKKDQTEDSWHAFDTVFNYHFATLLIKVCANLASYYNEVDDIESAIKNHFGVE
jgi:hypothetical protein